MNRYAMEHDLCFINYDPKLEELMTDPHNQILCYFYASKSSHFSALTTTKKNTTKTETTLSHFKNALYLQDQEFR